MAVEAAGEATQRGSAKEASETIKNWIDILKAALALILIGALLFLISCDRERLKNMARDVGISKVSAPGVEIALGVSSDALPRSQAALQDAQSQLRMLRGRYSTAVNALRELQGQLAGSNSTIAPAARQSVAAVLERAPETLRSTQRSAVALREAQARTNTAIARLPGSGDSSLGYGVVFGGDREESEARAQLNFARRLPGGSKLFRRQGFYRSVVVFPTRDAATAALPTIKALNRYSADAYVVTLASWCPGADLTEDPVVCSY